MNVFPLYQQIANRLRETVAESAPGTRLSSEPALAAAWKVSRFTVTKAVEELVSQGLVVRRQGVGTFVAEKPLRRTPGFLLSFSEAVGAAGRLASHRLLSFGPIQSVAGLPFSQDEPLLAMDRLRFVDGVPIARHQSTLPMALAEVTKLTEQVASREDFSFYRHLSDHGHSVVQATERMTARLATAVERDILNLPAHAVVIVVIRQSFDRDSRILDVVEASYDARHYYYESVLHRHFDHGEGADEVLSATSAVHGGPSLDLRSDVRRPHPGRPAGG